MSQNPVVFWFRQDLRLNDNPALTAAAQAGRVLPVYILDDESAANWRMGGASRWWLHHSLQKLKRSLDGNLHFFCGDAAYIIPQLVEAVGAQGVYWNRCYEPWRVARDTVIKEHLAETGCQGHSFNGSLLWEPWQVLKKDGTPYKVFTPYFRKGCLGQPEPRKLLPQPALELFTGQVDSLPLDQLDLLPAMGWYKKMEKFWHIGEEGAGQAHARFLEDGLQGYKEGRDFPARDQVSRLSPHLHFGEISPHQVWHATQAAGLARNCEHDLDHFLSELAWREFSYYTLYHFPALPEQCFNTKFNAFPWTRDGEAYSAWQWGKTGYPIIDAGMRELWETGSMHNRVRMVVASFLVKNQRVDWRLGQRWFWDCLVDADLASNSFGWQWVAGCGADAAPYFRIFNPVTQGEKFDRDGVYVRRFVPELQDVPDTYLHSPWLAPQAVLKKAGVVLGETYPEPVVDLRASREAALNAYQHIKGRT